MSVSLKRFEITRFAVHMIAPCLVDILIAAFSRQSSNSSKHHELKLPVTY